MAEWTAVGRVSGHGVVLVLVLIAFLPTPANAASVRVDIITASDPRGSGPVRVLRYQARPGEANRVEVRFQRGSILVSDPAGLDPGDGCRLEGRRARCAFAAPFSKAEGRYYGGNPIAYLRLGDRDDRAIVGGLAPDRGGAGASFEGGDGDDTLSAGKGTGIYAGGPGDDRMVGGGMFDVFDEGVASNGSDTITARGSLSTISYARRTRSVSVDMRGKRDAGERGERDLVRIMARRGDGATLLGGVGDDLLVGDSRDNAIAGGRGTDRVVGGSGNDFLYVDGGESPLAGFEMGGLRTADRAEGGPGTDYMVGNRGPNALIGGTGRDTLVGGPGRDRLLARDRSRDEIGCGAGRDRTSLDVRDYSRARRSDRCERVSRSGPALAVVLGGAGSPSDPGMPVSFRGRGSLDMGCPGDAAPRCRGSISLMRSGTLVARGHFNLIRGRKGVVRLRVTRRGTRLIGSGTLRVQAVIRSRTRFGRAEQTRVRTAISAGFQ